MSEHVRAWIYKLCTSATKTAAPKYRERAELWGIKGNKVLTGVYPDGSLGTYGGGVDPGETVIQGGQREYLEEAGRSVKNVQQVGRAIRTPWNFQEAGDAAAKKRFAQRAQAFPDGSRTTHLMGTIHGRKKPSIAGETAPIKDIRFRSLSAAVRIQTKALALAPAARKKKLRTRLKVLRHLESITSGD